MDPVNVQYPPGALDQISAAAVVAVPLCYVCSKKAPLLIRQALVACIWVALLSIPCFSEMPIHLFPTMIASVLSFIMPLKLTQLVQYPPRADTAAASKKNDDDNSSDNNTNDTTLSWKEFGSFGGGFLFYAIPLSRAKKPVPSLLELLRRNAHSLLIIAGKITIVPLFELALNQLANKYPSPSLKMNPVPYMQIEILFTFELIAMSWSTDIQAVAVNVLTAGYIEMLYMHNYPFFSSSLRDLWGRRYNLLINTLLKETVYIPAQNYYGCSKQLASLLAFLTSGLLHSWVAHFAFGGGVVRACLFFISQALWMNFVEAKAWYRDSVPSILKTAFTITYFYGTAWLYAGLFVEAMPDWLEKNPQTVPDVPILRDVTNTLAVWLGLVEAEQEGLQQ